MRLECKFCYDTQLLEMLILSIEWNSPNVSHLRQLIEKVIPPSIIPQLFLEQNSLDASVL
jgi:hypothetical protein